MAVLTVRNRHDLFEMARELFRENVTVRGRIILNTGIYFLINSIYPILGGICTLLDHLILPVAVGTAGYWGVAVVFNVAHMNCAVSR